MFRHEEHVFLMVHGQTKSAKIEFRKHMNGLMIYRFNDMGPINHQDRPVYIAEQSKKCVSTNTVVLQNMIAPSVFVQ